MYPLTRFLDIIQMGNLSMDSRRRFILLIAALVAISTSCASASEFVSILTNPQAYNHQHVSLVGVVVGDGPEFELFETASDARNIVAASRSFFVRAKGPWKRVRPYDLHRVRVIGMVQADRHGIWGNPCEILLEKIEVLSRGPVIPPSMPFGVFRNEGSKEVSVKLFSSAGVQATFHLSPQESVELPINDGTIKVFSLGELLIADGSLEVNRLSRYYDVKHGTFYYRITDKRVEKMLPNAVNYWKWVK